MKFVGVVLICIIICDIFGAQVQTCGRRQGIGGLIVGSKNAKNDWPWLVAFVKIPENKFFCTGSLVSECVIR